jgi:hypothetical protein
VVSQLVLEHGGFQLFDLGIWTPIEGQTASRNISKGQAYNFRLVAGKKIDMLIGEIHWSNGDWEVRVLEAERAPDSLRRLEHGLRMGLQRQTRNRAVAEIRVARCKDGNWSNMFKTSRSEMKVIIGKDIGSFLSQFGNAQVETRESILGDVSNRRGDLCVLFDDDNSLIPVVVYFATRVLPISQNVQA